MIESILLGIPLPAFYFNQDSDGAHQVVDGVQRLTTISRFMSGALTLRETQLEYLSDFKNVSFASLEAPVKRRFSGTQIVAHVIEPQTPDEVKFDIFNRVNTGGSPLTAQEIRHCMSKTRSRDFLRTLVQTAHFDKATDFAFWGRGLDNELVRDDRRMADREMALRFCAFRTKSVDDYAMADSLDSFLLQFTREIDRGEVSDEMIDLLHRNFDQAMANCALILGDGAFRRWPLSATRRGPINRAIFESQALALYEFPSHLIIENRNEIAQQLRALFEDSEYDGAVRSGTGDPRKVRIRLQKPVTILERLL